MQVQNYPPHLIGLYCHRMESHKLKLLETGELEEGVSASLARWIHVGEQGGGEEVNERVEEHKIVVALPGASVCVELITIDFFMTE